MRFPLSWSEVSPADSRPSSVRSKLASLGVSPLSVLPAASPGASSVGPAPPTVAGRHLSQAGGVVVAAATDASQLAKDVDGRQDVGLSEETGQPCQTFSRAFRVISLPPLLSGPTSAPPLLATVLTLIMAKDICLISAILLPPLPSEGDQ